MSDLKPILLLEKKLSSENELTALAAEIALHLEDTSLVLLSGDLGAGKTTTVRFLCAFFGLQSVQSPTYAIHQRYQNSMKTIDHFDLYRLQTEDELVSTGFWDLLQQKNSLVLIEWFERISDTSWLEFESQKRKVFGLKIKVENPNRVFQFFQLR